MSSFWSDVKQKTTPNLTCLIEPLLTHAVEHAADKPSSGNNPKAPPAKNKKTTPKRNGKQKQPLKASKKAKTEADLTIDNFM